MNDTLSLSGVFLSSFLGATLLPGGSEAVLFGVLKSEPRLYWPVLQWRRSATRSGACRRI